MTNEFRDQGRLIEEDRETSSGYIGRSARRANEPFFTGVDVAAFAIALIMICGPLAMGAFRF